MRKSFLQSARGFAWTVQREAARGPGRGCEFLRYSDQPGPAPPTYVDAARVRPALSGPVSRCTAAWGAPIRQHYPAQSAGSDQSVHLPADIDVAVWWVP